MFASFGVTAATAFTAGAPLTSRATGSDGVNSGGIVEDKIGPAAGTVNANASVQLDDNFVSDRVMAFGASFFADLA